MIETTPVDPGERAPPPVGVLVLNLGTPAAPDPASVRRYLREFLGDPRVVEVNRALWAVLLNAVILPFRSRASARAYAKVWTDDGSPLLVNTRAAARALGARLGAGWHVAVGMRYGEPSLARAFDELREAGCERVVVAPLFPQASNTTTGTAYAECMRVATAGREAPALQFVAPFYDDAGYVDALAHRVEEATDGLAVDHLVFSYHGLPESYVLGGDPYLCHCNGTSWALARRLGLARERWDMVFQSRFGRQPWLRPYADEFVPALAREHARVAVVLPGFAADCLETIEEIGIRLRADFVDAGGRELVVVPALNDHPRWIEALEQLVRGVGAPPR